MSCSRHLIAPSPLQLAQIKMKYLSGILLALGLLLLVGCGVRVKTVEVERLKVEYKDRLKMVRDSIYQHDSIYIERRGDTVYQDRWHTRWREMVRHDTAYIERRDSVSYPVVVEVEKPRSWLQRAEISIYRIVIILLLVFAGWYTVRRLLWVRRL